MGEIETKLIFFRVEPWKRNSFELQSIIHEKTKFAILNLDLDFYPPPPKHLYPDLKLQILFSCLNLRISRNIEKLGWKLKKDLKFKNRKIPVKNI